MRALGVVLLLAFAGGCTSVKMVQREGCWVKRTEKIFGRVREEVGPCTRPQPRWAEDRLTRLVQECMAQGDYRWHGRAIDAWSKGKPYPAQPPQDEMLRTCLEEARVSLITENETLKGRVDELSADRNTLRHDTDQDRAALRASHDRLTEYLGEAAKKPTAPATATATATSDGKATNESGATLSSGSTSGSGANGAPAIPTAGAPPSPAEPAAAPPGGTTPPTVAPPLQPASAKPAIGETPKRTAPARSARKPRPAAPAGSAGACDLCTQPEARAAQPVPPSSPP